MLAIVTWVQGKAAAHRDLVEHYHQLTSRILFPMRERLSECSIPTTAILGLENDYLGGGPIGEWWPSLQGKEPGFVSQLPPALVKAMQTFQEASLKCDARQKQSWQTLMNILADICDPGRQRRTVHDILPEVRVDAAGASLPSLVELWAKDKSMNTWLDETAALRGPSVPRLSIILQGTVIAQDRKAHRLLDETLATASQRPDLIETRHLAHQAANLAAEALALVDAEISMQPQKRWIWPKRVAP